MATRTSTLAPAADRLLEPFDVNILGADSHVWLSVQSSQGSVYGVPRLLPSNLVPSTDGASTIADWLGGAVRYARHQAGAEALGVGKALSDLVFGVPDVAALLHQTRGAAAAAGAQLLVRVLAAPDSISSYPWELMVDPQRPERFLTLARDVHIVRAGRSRTYPVRQAPIEPPLNLLLVMSNPKSNEQAARQETPFDLYAEKRALLAELRPLADRGLLHIEVEDRPTVEKLRSRIGSQRRGFHLLHFLGHARPDGLRLEENGGTGKLVPSEDFATLLQQMPDLRLAVFAGCETARAPQPVDADLKWPGPLSTADYCVRDACPMVVGMQAVLPFGTERIFTRFFYQALTGGQPVVEALRLARHAIRGDEYAGGSQVNWAVPCLFVGGSLPGPITDPTARAVPPSPTRRVMLRPGIRQGDLRFISRLNELRVSVDVLCGRSDARLLHLVGVRGTGKTAFLDRTLEELSDDVIQVFVSAQRLMARDDPLAELCTLVTEVLKMAGRNATPQGHLGAADWWERLLEDVSDAPLALVIDDGNVLAQDDARGIAVLTALGEFTKRRSRARLALASTEEITQLTGPLTAREVQRVILQQLLWPEIWQWIRRNLPVLTRFEERDLAPFYSDLSQLEQWEQLAAEISGRSSLLIGDFPAIVEEVAGRTSALSASEVARPPIFGAEVSEAPVDLLARRALRVAVAGPFTQGREREFSRSITQFAAEHHVGGRVMAGESADTANSLAELLSIRSPFDDGGSGSPDTIRAWINTASSLSADIVVLEFGGENADEEIDEGVDRLHKAGALVVAAGGNAGSPVYPAWLPQVLAVGALEDNDVPAAYSPYFRADRKPDLYARKSMEGSTIAEIVPNPDSEGTTFSALHVAAAAIIVWASDRSQTAQNVKETLLETGVRIKVARREHGRRLDVDAALTQTRRNLILDNLQWDPLERDQLLAETGLRPEVADPLLEALVREGTIHRSVVGGHERYEDPNSLYLEYAALRLLPSGDQRTRLLTRLVDRAGELTKRARFSQSEVTALWDSGHPGRRVVALGVVQACPELGTVAVVASGIATSLSAFEQFQALVAARKVVDHRQRSGTLTEAERAEICRAVDAGDKWIKEGPDRTRQARLLLKAIGAKPRS